MTERKVDVMDRAGKILHTYPVTLPASIAHPTDNDYEKAALAEAHKTKLVPDIDAAHLKAKMHAAH
jgi:hypothetical protein